MEDPNQSAITQFWVRFKSLLILAIAGAILFVSWNSAGAQTYYFELVRETVHVFWNSDGTQSLDYVFVFNNETWASPIDFVDIGLPNGNYVMDSIYADVDGKKISNIEVSPYVEHGVALDLGTEAIPPGETGVVHAYIGTVHQVLYPDTSVGNDVSAVFIPTWFDSQFLFGSTDLTVIFHLPPGVQPDEPRWHSSPEGFPEEPETGFDEEGRITYTWHNASANGYTQYTFGASFPGQYVPESSILKPDPFEPIKIFVQDALEIWPLWVFGGGISLFALYSIIENRRRKLRYLPPKISIEGHGIKRGLTAVEAAILMEQPVDKILTMILFSVIMKGGARVRSREPLELEILTPAPDDGLRSYEGDFLEAFKLESKSKRRASLQKLMVNLVRTVAKKMKGFSRKETVVYYQGIIDQAWKEVEAAQTPQVMSEKYEDNMQWTMLDRDYEDRTRRVLNRGPIYIPTWWARYDPGYHSTSTATGFPTSGGGGASLPQLPGADFAANIVGGVQNFSSNVVGNVADFTNGITRQTNPIPKSSSGGKSSWKSSGGGGSGCACACACACAGCACACAGGGR